MEAYGKICFVERKRRHYMPGKMRSLSKVTGKEYLIDNVVPVG